MWRNSSERKEKRPPITVDESGVGTIRDNADPPVDIQPSGSLNATLPTSLFISDISNGIEHEATNGTGSLEAQSPSSSEYAPSSLRSYGWETTTDTDGSTSDYTSAVEELPPSTSILLHSGSPTPPPLPTRTTEPYKPHKRPTTKGKSYVKYRKSADGLTVTAIFDLPRVKKDDMHVSFQGNRFVVSWQTVRITEREEPLDADDLGSGTRILRELERKKYRRTIPLPDGTRFEEIRVAHDGRHLILTYPNISTSRDNPILHDGL